jgi:very-short-patch-repair endonuclease
MTEAESLLFTDSHQAKDANRDAYLATLGIKTLRFTNTEILKNCTEVLYCIEQSIVSFTSFEGGREHFLRAGGC